MQMELFYFPFFTHVHVFYIIAYMDILIFLPCTLTAVVRTRNVTQKKMALI